MGVPALSRRGAGARERRNERRWRALTSLGGIA